MKEIPLTQGKVALVDDEDYEQLRVHKWYVRRIEQKFFYACRNARAHRIVLMHRQILGVKSGERVKFLNSNTLDNRRENLSIHNVYPDKGYYRTIPNLITD
jgi:hypothetical protein